MNPRAFVKLGRKRRRRRGRLIHSLSCAPACSAHSQSPSFLYFWRDLILVSQAPGAHKGLLPVPVPVPARVFAIHDIRNRREPSGRKQNSLSFSLREREERGGFNALWILNWPYLHRRQVMDGFVCDHGRNNCRKRGLEKVTGINFQCETANFRLAASRLQLWNKINGMMQPHSWHPS